ncbi:hypothetical protein [Verrucosispora sp. WMMD1129]|uniref:hypothetical protein n=1 Tax=Verrucosispora sp. WMMD1129 TaxID=3016093 RepID=UPI00249C5179|nr:hypothetical protein [Verrucosispora sp. WMMD1129]WFE44153.1 hypothetical protein O7624_07285 [Verrucosispora sp. WMMD1129]
MVAVALTKLWINRLPDGAAIAAHTAPQRDRHTTTPGQVRTYSGGTRRPAAAPAYRDHTYTFTLRHITTADLDTLTTWTGQAVQIRNDRGLLITAIYYGLTITEHRGDRYDATITAHDISPPDQPAHVF